MANRWGKVETVSDIIFLDSKITVDSDCSHEIKRWLLLRRKSSDKSRQHIKKRRHHFTQKVHIIKKVHFSTSHVRMWELNHKGLKNWCFQIVMLEKTLESPLDSKEIKPVNPKGNYPEYSLEELVLKLKLQYFGHLMRRANSLEKTLMLGKTAGRRRKGWQRMRWLGDTTDSVDRTANLGR